MSGWMIKKLKDVIDFNYGKGLPQRNRQNGPYPVYGSSGIVDYHKESLVSGPGLIIGRKGNVGSVYWEVDNYYPIDTVYYVSDTKDGSNLKYLYYLLQTLSLDKLNSDAAVPGLNRAQALNLTTSIPKAGYQKRITEIIEKYDLLIDNNKKRINILEEMAQRLYTEWFVKFRFPGYKDVKMVDSGSEFGEIPEGWEVKKLSDIGKVITGSTPSKQKPKYYGSEYMFIKTPDFNQGTYIINSDEKLSQDGFEVQKTRLLPAHTVMVTTIGTIGKVAITTEQSFTNQQINSLVLKNQEDYVFYYFFAKNLKKKLEGLGSNGATMGNVSKSKFESMKIIYPSTQLLADFFTLTSSNFLEIECLMSNNQYLVKMRDLLIENLVTGKKLLKN